MVIVTTGLEDNYNDKAYSQVLIWIKEILNTTLIARSPVIAERGPKVCSSLDTANYCELHLPDSQFPQQPKPNVSGSSYSQRAECIWNNDGNLNSLDDQLSLFRKFSKCSVLFAWEPRSQGRRGNTASAGGGRDKFVEPRNRHFDLPLFLVKSYQKLLHDYQRKEIH